MSDKKKKKSQSGAVTNPAKKKKKGQSGPIYKWNEVIIKEELILTPSKSCEVPNYVRKYLPKIKSIDWYWSARIKKDKTILVICFRNKKDATAFKETKGL